MKYSYETKICPLSFYEEEGKIVKIEFGHCEKDSDYLETQLIKSAYEEILEYMDGRRKHFDFPFEIRGTAFEKKVYKALLNIPYGELKTYRDIAIEIGHDKAYRAVGLANHKNNLPIVVPCHRVVGSDGKLTGFAGGLSVKQALIDLEKENI
ncbi:methylated-DNA--[protein]-cysteine S-methyltransferase [Anaerosphaera multitolerans]|uniref:Methylated-DNA--protein-cysteine methyltransferase n=1 Tax=Anaerosphaera multitolerans TaxID=2487351 RepID=A0A437S9M5_9FIRM|nr:methylated-DNA--[protein]-cysteine S-methyltransferase [Anaerosphaera multitolerans]RVU55517.1 methylated-DNA--[protein]-cysteine S-methyltransferase [Anaerosphaera multitolerans]